MLKGEKLKYIKMEIKKLDIDIIGLSEMRWPINSDFSTED